MFEQTPCDPAVGSLFVAPPEGWRHMSFPGSKSAACHWSPIDSGSDEENEIHLRYYADDETRARWRSDFKFPVPEKQAIPFPRPWIPVWDPYGGEEEHGD